MYRILVPFKICLTSFAATFCDGEGRECDPHMTYACKYTMMEHDNDACGPKKLRYFSINGNHACVLRSKETDDETGPNLQGNWTLSEIRSTGISTDTWHNLAKKMQGKSITIENGILTFPDNLKCKLGPAKDEIIRNDMKTFGSFGGDWSQIGFHGTENAFNVVTYELNCIEQLTVDPHIRCQIEKLCLLGFGRIYTVMNRR